MFRMNPLQISELCHFATMADKEARSDLAGGYIRDENDYTANFTGALRRIINSNSQEGLKATSFLLGTSEERKTGCDATIIVGLQDMYKIAIFEAKLPWPGGQYKNWDYIQKSSGLSHYSDQLARQKRLIGMAVFEMFYCGYEFGKQPSFLQKEGSTCVWHQQAIKFDSSRPSSKIAWFQADLEGLLKQGNLSIGEILQSVCECKMESHLK